MTLQSSEHLEEVVNCSDHHLCPSAVQIYDLSLYSLAFVTTYGYITNSQPHQPLDGLIAQLVEHYTDIAEVMGSSLVVYITAIINHVLTIAATAV